jgi:hypothetical protein
MMLVRLLMLAALGRGAVDGGCPPVPVRLALRQICASATFPYEPPPRPAANEDGEQTRGTVCLEDVRAPVPRVPRRHPSVCLARVRGSLFKTSSLVRQNEFDATYPVQVTFKPLLIRETRRLVLAWLLTPPWGEFNTTPVPISSAFRKQEAIVNISAL